MTILCDGRTIEVDWQKKKIKNMYLRIGKKGNIVVSSPMRMSEERVKAFVETKVDWVLQKQQEQYHADSGCLYLQGKQFRLEEFAPMSEVQIINQHAERVLQERFDFLCRVTELTPELQIKKMSGKYGFCTPKKNLITLNPRLVMAPPACIDYVILHEFMHLYVGGHGPDFHSLVKTYLPNERGLSKELNRYPI